MKTYFFIVFITLTITYAINTQEEHEQLQIQNLTEFEYKSSKPSLDKDLQENLDDLNQLFDRAKISACMLIIKTSLSNGNPSVNHVMKITKHDKTKTFDKVVAMMLDTCTGSIDDKTLDLILSSEDPNIWRDEFKDLLTFNKNVFQIIGPQLQNTPSEKKVLDEIRSVIKNPDISLPTQDEDKIDFLTERLGVYKYFFIGSVMGVLLFLVFVFFYNLIRKS